MRALHLWDGSAFDWGFALTSVLTLSLSLKQAWSRMSVVRLLCVLKALSPAVRDAVRFALPGLSTDAEACAYLNVPLPSGVGPPKVITFPPISSGSGSGSGSGGASSGAQS